jgi:dipeptidyl aminopeptidase/acylaminoacyl peptidase
LKRLKIIEGGNHSFNDPAHLEQVISLTSDWLKRHL